MSIFNINVSVTKEQHGYFMHVTFLGRLCIDAYDLTT